MTAEYPLLSPQDKPDARLVDDTRDVSVSRAEARPRRRGLEAALWVGVIGYAAAGQYLLLHIRPTVRDGVIFYGLGVVLFLILVARLEALRAQPRWPGWVQTLAERVGRVWIRIGLVAVALFVGYLNMGLLRTHGNAPNYWPEASLWAISTALVIGAFAHRPSFRIRAGIVTLRWELVAVAALTIVGGILRFVYLGQVPEVLSGDEGSIGLMALNALHGRVNPFGTFIGTSTLYLYVHTIPYLILGTNPLNLMILRLPEAIIGVITIPVVFLLGRRMFDTRVGLIAAALLSVAHMHVHFSRIVDGIIADALLTTLAVYFFYGGLKFRRPWELALSGLTVGFHLYIYMGGRLTILFLLATLAVLAVVQPRLIRDNLGGLLAFGLVFVVVSMPMYVWMTTNPGEFNARLNTLGIFQNGWLPEEVARSGKSVPAILWDQLWKSLLDVNYFPLRNFYNSPLPMLDPITAVPFMLGLAYGLLRAFELRFLLLNAWFWSAIVGGEAVLLHPWDDGYRILIVLPALMILAAIALVKLLEFAYQAFLARPRILAGVATAFLLVVAFVNVRAYFVDYAPHCLYEGPGTRWASILGAYAGQIGPDYKIYMYGDNDLRYGIFPNMQYLTNNMPGMNVEGAQLTHVDFVDPGRNAVFVFVPARMKDAPPVEQRYPNGQWITFKDCGRTVLQAYQVELK